MLVTCDDPNCKYRTKVDAFKAKKPGKYNTSCDNKNCKKDIVFNISMEEIREETILGYLVLYYKEKKAKRFPVKHGKYVFGRMPKTYNGEILLSVPSIDKEHGISRTHLFLEVTLQYDAHSKKKTHSVIIKDTSSKYRTAISKKRKDGPQLFLAEFDEVYIDYGYTIYLAVEQTNQGKLLHTGHYHFQYQTPDSDEITQRMARFK